MSKCRNVALDIYHNLSSILSLPPSAPRKRTRPQSVETDLDSLGVNITTTQQLLGHEDVSTTQRYVAVPSEAARQAIELRTRRRGAAAGQEVDHHGDRLLTSDTGGGDSDPWVAELKVMLDPANLIEALNSENVEDVQLNVLPTTAVSRALQGASPEE